ncbi:MAG: VWA domain-containing protein [Propioniciclava sp.]
MSAEPDRPITRDQRWALMLGSQAGEDEVLTAGQREMDEALATLYDDGVRRGSGVGLTSPRVARWLGDIRSYFPQQVVQVMQTDAIDRLGLRQLLLEPEMLAAVQPDVTLVATLAGLGKALPEESRATARTVVAQVVAQVERRIANRTRQAVRGALNRAQRTTRPRPGDIDWDRTIRANLKNYLPETGTIIPERLIGFGRKQTSVQREIVLCVDQSGSMATSVVYASIYAAVMASIAAVRTSLVVYDTEVVDLTEKLSDPVEVIFGTQLGGGNDGPKALAYCESLITAPQETVLILISDLYEPDPEQVARRMNAIRESGVTVVCLLALDDRGTPVSNAELAADLSGLGIPTFACTPDAFPDLIGLAITRGDIHGWHEQQQAAATGP